MIILRRRQNIIYMDLETDKIITIRTKLKTYQTTMAELSHETPNMSVHDFIKKMKPQ